MNMTDKRKKNNDIKENEEINSKRAREERKELYFFFSPFDHYIDLRHILVLRSDLFII